MTHTADNTDRQESAVRSRLQFWLDRWPWWLWFITSSATWLACKTTGCVPMQNWNWRAGAYWHCTWCLKDTPAPSSVGGTTTSSEEQAHGNAA